MKLLLVNRALGTLFGGGESFDLNAARHLQRRGHDVVLLTARPLVGQANNQFQDIPVVYVPSPELRRYAYATQTLNSKLSAAFYHFDNYLFERAAWRWLASPAGQDFDIVQCCSLFSLPQWLLKRGQPVVSWLPGPPSGRIRKSLPGLLSRPHFGLFTHGSPEWCLQKLGLGRERHYSIIEPGIELAEIDAVQTHSSDVRARLGIPADALVGITTARLVPIKNHQLLFEALALANQRHPRWHWLIVGDGPLSGQLKQQARQLGIEQQIHFLGYQPQTEVHHWLGAADLFALTSHYENFSIATLEAMGHSLPVIGTAVGYLQHLISQAGAGQTVPLNQPQALANTLADMASPHNRRRFGAAGRAFVEQLDWPLIAAKLEQCYQQTIQGRPA